MPALAAALGMPGDFGLAAGLAAGLVASPTIQLNTTQAGQQITRGDVHWGPAIGAPAGPISFGFRTSPPGYNVSGENVQGTFSPLTASEQAAARAALALWASVANITFSDFGASNAATIEFANYSSSTDNSEAFAFLPTSGNTSAGSHEGDIFINTFYASTTNDSPGTYEFMTFLHEIGHALGLQHPGDYNAGPGQTITYANSAQYVEDTRQYTLMSYFSELNTGGSYSVFDQTPMKDDIAAIQRLYGANTNTQPGNTTYGFNSNAASPFAIASASEHVVFTVYDTGGTDNLDFSGYSQNQTINLNAESFSSVGGNIYNVSIAQGVTIENAIGGGGNDALIGNVADNILIGGGGNDTLAGGAGADQLIGGPGLDTADYSSSPAPVSVNLQTGTAVGGDAQGDSFSGIENIIGSAFADTLVGDGGVNVFDGGPGGDTITGGGGADWFLLRAASYGVDTFTDFSEDQGDRIVLDHTGFGLAGVGSLAAAGVSFVYGLTPSTAAPTILDSRGNLYWDPDGTGPSPATALASVPHAEGLVSVTNFETGGWNVVATGAFNNDSTSDILWQNASNGATSEWLMANGRLAGSPPTPGAPGWNVIAAGNFNGDGTADLLWRHAASDMTAEWLMAPNGGVGSLLGTPPVQGWNLLASADFNGDHITDLFWQHAASGATAEWLMAPTGGVGSLLSTPPVQGWNLLGRADFNGDGTTDLMWQHAASGATAEWLMAPTGGVGALLSTPPAQGWNMVATGDFNGDHIADLFWQHAATGATAEWLMAPTGGVGALLNTPAAPGWNVVATGDFNGDHITDLLWQHASSGATAEWLMAPTGGAGVLLSTPPAQGWNVVAAADFNGDGTTDPLWQHASAGVTSLWLTAPTGGVGSFQDTPTAAGLSLITAGDFSGDGATDLMWRNPSTGATTTWMFSHLTQQDFLVV